MPARLGIFCNRKKNQMSIIHMRLFIKMPFIGNFTVGLYSVSSCVAPTAWRTKTTILIYPGGWVEQRPKRSSWHNKEKGVLSPPSNPAMFIMTSLEGLLKHTLHQLQAQQVYNVQIQSFTICVTKTKAQLEPIRIGN